MNTTTSETWYETSYDINQNWACWVAFRTGGFPPINYKTLTLDKNDEMFQSFVDYFGASIVSVSYDDSRCTKYKNTTTLADLDLRNEWLTESDYGYGIGNCTLGLSVRCEAQDSKEYKCRINVRMSALLTLTICLMTKAAYMVAVNCSLRRSVKSQCLTFGDVIVASAMDRNSRIHNECMVNAGDGYRHKTIHTCHKHCKDREPSTTGDSVGHCQRCKKYNIIDRAADLFHPSVAVKYKKSLISSLGTTALIQMTILMICSAVMLAVSVILAYGFGSAAAALKSDCIYTDDDRCTISGEAQYLKGRFGAFGGFNSSSTISGMKALTNEAETFFLANGAQVLYSALYLLLTYNLTLISMESDWGKLERTRTRVRCTLVKGSGFAQSYLLQLPKRILYPMMVFSAVMHWLLGQAISARETIFAGHGYAGQHPEKSFYSVYLFRTVQK